eukprot:329191-Pleurochrysis_carterae.AAC.1
MPNEACIQHRVVTWHAVWEQEYQPDMKWWGTSHPLSYSRWLRLKAYALVRLSVEYFGVEEDGKTPV